MAIDRGDGMKKDFCLAPCKSADPVATVTCCARAGRKAWACTGDRGEKIDVDFYPSAGEGVDTFSMFKFYNEPATHDTICGMFGLKLGMKLHGNRESRPLAGQ
jgi:hypothetical protein